MAQKAIKVVMCLRRMVAHKINDQRLALFTAGKLLSHTHLEIKPIKHLQN